MLRRSVGLVLVALALGSCASDSDDVVLVFAASSLTDAFSDIEAAYEAQYPSVDIRLNLAGSSALREQILDGAPADVFAAADEAIMAQVLDAEVGAEASQVFATNRLQLVVPVGNPAGVDGLADLAAEELLVGVCAPAVPCGRLAAEVFELAGLTPSPDTTEPDVRSLLTKVVEDELDVGVVYATDVVAAGAAVEGIEIPAAVNAETRYPITSLSRSPEAERFVAFVVGTEGRRILADHGFGLP